MTSPLPEPIRAEYAVASIIEGELSRPGSFPKNVAGSVRRCLPCRCWLLIGRVSGCCITGAMTLSKRETPGARPVRNWPDTPEPDHNHQDLLLCRLRPPGPDGTWKELWRMSMGRGYCIQALTGLPVLVAHAARRGHFALHPMSSGIVEAFREELGGFETSRGTVRFQPYSPLPRDLVVRMVEAGILENGV
jgi:hypothetical protein